LRGCRNEKRRIAEKTIQRSSKLLNESFYVSSFLFNRITAKNLPDLNQFIFRISHRIAGLYVKGFPETGRIAKRTVYPVMFRRMGIGLRAKS